MAEPTIELITAEPTLDTVEKTVMKFLRDGYTVAEISRLMALPIGPVIAELAHKGILRPDATFQTTPPKQMYQVKH